MRIYQRKHIVISTCCFAAAQQTTCAMLKAEASIQPIPIYPCKARLSQSSSCKPCPYICQCSSRMWVIHYFLPHWSRTMFECHHNPCIWTACLLQSSSWKLWPSCAPYTRHDMCIAVRPMNVQFIFFMVQTCGMRNVCGCDHLFACCEQLYRFHVSSFLVWAYNGVCACVCNVLGAILIQAIYISSTAQLSGSTAQLSSASLQLSSFYCYATQDVRAQGLRVPPHLEED